MIGEAAQDQKSRAMRGWKGSQLWHRNEDPRLGG